MIQFTRLSPKQLLNINPPLYIRKVQELVIHGSAVRLHRDQPHDLLYQDEMLGRGGRISQLVQTDELPEMLLRKLNCFCCFIISDQLHYL